MDKAREFGAGPLFIKSLPLLMECTLEDQEHHLLVKVIDRVLYKFNDLMSIKFSSSLCLFLSMTIPIPKVVRLFPISPISQRLPVLHT